MTALTQAASGEANTAAGAAGDTAEHVATTAAAAEHAATQASASAAAYQNAFAMTVPPHMIAANRMQLTMLIATNLLGQNTPAIAATEAHYMQMWAQDAAAMYGYAGSSASASQLAPFTEPPQNLQITADGGNVNVIMPSGNTKYDISADAHGGNLNIPSTLNSVASHNTITVNSGGGDISITKG